MTRPAVTMGDVQASTLELLRMLYTETPPLHDGAPVTGLTFGTKRPYTAELATPRLPYAVVLEETWGPTTWPLTATLNLRVIVWAANPDATKDIANWIQARLLAYTGGPALVSFRYLSGPIGGWDPDHPDTPMSAFTIRSRPRPQVL